MRTQQAIKSNIFRGAGVALAIAGACLVTLSGGPAIESRGIAALRVPRGFRIEQVTTPDLVSYPMMGTLDDRGRLFICESSGPSLNNEQTAAHPDYKIRRLRV